MKKLKSLLKKTWKVRLFVWKRILKNTAVLSKIPCYFENRNGVYVVVQFYPWFKFYFPLFLGVVMYDNEFETKENKI